MFDYKLEHICSYTATLAVPEVIDPVPEGIRANFYVTGARSQGLKSEVKLRPAGGDWITICRDDTTNFCGASCRRRCRFAPRRLATGHPDYLWLNRVHCLGVGAANLATNSVAYHVYAVR